MVLLAPDMETSEVLDAQLSNLAEEAAIRGIPSIYCLSRRQLAKALDVSMRQVAVAVFDADGAFELFKKIKSFLETNDS